jgi:hypothetical protein
MRAERDEAVLAPIRSIFGPGTLANRSDDELFGCDDPRRPLELVLLSDSQNRHGRSLSNPTSLRDL